MLRPKHYGIATLRSRNGAIAGLKVCPLKLPPTKFMQQGEIRLVAYHQLLTKRRERGYDVHFASFHLFKRVSEDLGIGCRTRFRA